EIRAALLWRAAALGHDLTLDPDLRLLVDGQVVRGIKTSDRVYRFEIPAGASDVLLASCISVPTEVDAAARDLRRLWVPVERIVLSDEALSIEAQHLHPALAAGFHAAETGHRWTDGRGRLPTAWLTVFAGAFTLEVCLASSALPYRSDPSADALVAA